MKRTFFSILPLVAAGISILLNGCVTPDVSKTPELPLDDNPLQGGISSQDIRTIATLMTPAILAFPELTKDGQVCRIKLSAVKNRSRFFIDNELLMKRLTVELNRYGKGQVRFLSSNMNVQQSRAEISKDRERTQIQEYLKALAQEIAVYPLFHEKTPVKMAVIPVLNTNLVNLNADSITAMLRAEIVNASKGKIQFVMPVTTNGADYLLTGQFIPEALKKEGIINLANYIEVIDERVKQGKSMYIEQFAAAGVNRYGAGIAASTPKESYLLEMLRNPELRKDPNADKDLNIMIVNQKTKTAVFEKMIPISRRVTDHSGKADYILSGEISGLSQRKNGVSADYLLFSFQLTEPDSNEVVWEDAYEVQRVSEAGIEYR